MAAKMILQKLAFFHHSEKFPEIQKHHFQFSKKPINQAHFSKNYSLCHSSNGNYFPVTSNHGKIRRLVQEFNPEIPIEEAFTPPSSWYTDPDFYSLELNQIFYKGWQPVGYTEQIKEPRDFFTGSRLGSIEYVVCRDEKGTLHAFHNVCRHHASLVASGTGKKSCFVCPYHGWTYGLDGALVKATRIKGIKNFKVNEMGLVPLKVAVWGPFVLINFDGVSPNEDPGTEAVGNEWLGSAAEILRSSGVDTSLDYVCRRVYTLECNWKVFCDNYLDGGYHVPYAHKDLASGLQLDSYSTKDNSDFIEKSLEDSERVQDEDLILCKAVQQGLESPAYNAGRYSPTVEMAMHHFHCLLHQNLSHGISSFQRTGINDIHSWKTRKYWHRKTEHFQVDAVASHFIPSITFMICYSSIYLGSVCEHMLDLIYYNRR
ncbi:hypothetical protein DH2020_018320 [Rehmannia glutinosa]|uniref:Choline monooxygenase, chloroplastic n=1 Tax=Rehmannia glutinosa TaxID=99300 RepID=A0ABR0WKL1_REHGL